MADQVNNLQVPLAGWTVPRPVFKRSEQMTAPAGYPTTLAKLKAHLRKTDNAEDDYLTDLIASATDAVENYASRKLVPRRVRSWLDFLPGTGNEYTLYGAGTAQIPVRYANIGLFRWMELYGTPVCAWDSFHYISNDGTDNIFDASQYIIDYTDPDMPARIILQRGAVWPVDLQVAHSIHADYALGYQYKYGAWAPSTAYALGALVLNGDIAYQCTTAGTSASSSGPAGLGTTIADGTAVWKSLDPAGAVPQALKQAVLLIAAAFYSNRGDQADAMPDVLELPGVAAVLAPYRVFRVSTL